MKRITVSLSLLACLSFGFAQQSAYKMAGPYEVVARDGEYRSSKGGNERDMKNVAIFAERKLTHDD